MGGVKWGKLQQITLSNMLITKALTKLETRGAITSAKQAWKIWRCLKHPIPAYKIKGFITCPKQNGEIFKSYKWVIA